MSRLIDGDALIKALVRKEPFSDCARVVIAECMEEVRHAPTIEPEPQWIPCSERLPEEFCKLLACRKNMSIEIMYYSPVLTTRYPKGFSVLKNAFTWRQDNIIAWMPLPEPYKEES